jgi:hypothetical protein
MTTWTEIQAIYNKDTKIFEVLALILQEGTSTEFSNSIRNFKSPKANGISVLDIVLARQLHLEPKRDTEDIKVMLHLLPEEEFVRLAIEAVEALLDDFKSS